MSSLNAGRRSSSGSVSPIEDCEEVPDLATAAVAAKALPLTLTLVSNSETSTNTLKPGFGKMPRRTRFGLKAKRTLIRAGGVIDKTWGNRPQILLTATLPGSTIQAHAALAAWSSYVMDRVKTWLYDHSPTSTSMYAWEFQRRGALHLHYVQCCQNMNEVKYFQRHWGKFWYELMLDVCDRAGVDVFEREKGGSWQQYPAMIQTDVTIIEKSAAAYISKYLGKGSLSESERHFCPTRWWGVSRNLLSKLKEMTEEYTKPFLSFLEARKWMNKWHSATLDRAHKCYRYLHKAGGGETFVAFAKPEQMEEICQELPMLRTSSKTQNAPLSTTQSLEVFRRLLMVMEERFMKQSPPRFKEAYLKEMASLSCRVPSKFTPTVRTLTNLLTWNATLQLRLQSSHSLMAQKRILCSSETNLLNTLQNCEHKTLRSFARRKLEASRLTTSREECYARTSFRQTGDATNGVATKDIIPQRTPSYFQPSLLER